MVHGGCRSVGCYAMTDSAMEEIYGLVDEAFKGGQQKVQLQAFPFRMTAHNLARHSGDPNMPFWQMLKAGSDAFLTVEQPLRVAVCDRRYVFNPGVGGDLDPSALDPSALDPSAPCPAGIDSPTLAAATQPARTASVIAAPMNTGTVAYHANDGQPINASLRGLY
jgi:murein L,D-transpeptidase YafK